MPYVKLYNAFVSVYFCFYCHLIYYFIFLRVFFLVAVWPLSLSLSLKLGTGLGIGGGGGAEGEGEGAVVCRIFSVLVPCVIAIDGRLSKGSNPCRSGGRIFFSRYFDIRSTPVLPQKHLKDPGHSAKSTGGRLQLNTHTPYVCGFALCDMVHGCVVCTELAPRRLQFHVAPAMPPLRWIFKKKNFKKTRF